jgi:phage I-like protein
MLRNTLSIELLTAGATALPSEMRLFQRSTPTTKGVFLFDEASAASVAAAFSRLGRELSFDFEHSSVLAPFSPNPAEAGKSAGTFRVECKQGGCWATALRFTARARDMILGREYRWLSPTFMVEDKTLRVTEIIGCALTNNPSTLSPQPIVLSAGSATPAAGSTLSATEREICRMSGSTPEALVALRGSQAAVELSAEERTRELDQIARFTGVPRR